jgi:hypothetical protein
MLARNSGGGFTIYDAYSRCSEALTVYACAETSHKNKVMQAVFSLGPLREYISSTEQKRKRTRMERE